MPSSLSPSQAECCNSSPSSRSAPPSYSPLEALPRYIPRPIAGSVPPALAPPYASLAPPSRKPCRPPLRFKLSELPLLISGPVYHDRVYPSRDFALGVWEPDEEGVPPWSLSLESYYTMIHPAAWAILDDEYTTQRGFVMELARWCLRRKADGAEKGELDALETEMRAAQCGMREMFECLYGLHFIRAKYLSHYRDLAPPHWTEQEIILKTLSYEDNRRRVRTSDFWHCRFPEYSVWPLPVPVPSCVQRASLKPLVCIAGLSKYTYYQYIVPILDTDYHTTFQTTPTEDFARKYNPTRELSLSFSSVAQEAQK
ncbi:hypothetical protein JCM10207_005674 [Rhodosporidiobolus poonsookiae]